MAVHKEERSVEGFMEGPSRRRRPYDYSHITPCSLFVLHPGVNSRQQNPCFECLKTVTCQYATSQ
jgi:hypothetical protein